GIALDLFGSKGSVYRRAATGGGAKGEKDYQYVPHCEPLCGMRRTLPIRRLWGRDRKSTRLNSSHVSSSYAVFCLKKKISCDTPEVRSVEAAFQNYLSHERALLSVGWTLPLQRPVAIIRIFH